MPSIAKAAGYKRNQGISKEVFLKRVYPKLDVQKNGKRLSESYAWRVFRGEQQGLTRSQSRGHARKQKNEKSVTELKKAKANRDIIYKRSKTRQITMELPDEIVRQIMLGLGKPELNDWVNINKGEAYTAQPIGLIDGERHLADGAFIRDRTEYPLLHQYITEIILRYVVASDPSNESEWRKLTISEHSNLLARHNIAIDIVFISKGKE